MVGKRTRAKRSGRKNRPSRPPSAQNWVRLIAPAAYGFVLLMGLFSSERSVGGWAVAVLALFAGYLAWRVHALVADRSGQTEMGVGGTEGVELGLLAVLALASVHQLLPPLDPWWIVLNGLLLVGLAAVVRLPELLILPICAVLLGSVDAGGWDATWVQHLVHLEVLGLASGLLMAMERNRIAKLKQAMERLRLDAEHLHTRASSNGSEKKGDLTRLNETLYDFLKEVKENAEAHSALLAVRSARGHLFVKELVSDSHNLREEAGLDLTGDAFRWIMNNKKPLRIASVSDPASALGYYSGRVAVKSFIGVPIQDGEEEVEGILALDSLKSEAFPDDKLTMLRVATHQVSTILNQIRELEQVRREARDFKSLHEFSKQVGGCQTSDDLLALVLHVVAERVQPDFSALALLRGEGDVCIERVGQTQWEGLTGVSLQSGDGLVGWAMDSGQYLYYDRERPSSRRPIFSEKLKVPDFPTLLIHPIILRGEPLGALVLGCSSPLALDPAAIAFCDILCQQIAMGLAQVRSVEQLKSMASTDELTGLKNRRVLFHTAVEEVKRTRRYEHPLSVILIDVDHFKKVNDIYGHPAGDEVLRNVGALLRDHARETDLPARYGGEEFAMLLPDTDEAGAVIVAERVRQGLAAMPVEWEGHMLRVRASLGVAELSGQEDSVDKMLERADNALYEAKERGRNQVIRFSEISEYKSWA